MKKSLKKVEDCEYQKNSDAFCNLKNRGSIYKLDWNLLPKYNGLNPVSIYSKIVNFKK